MYRVQGVPEADARTVARILMANTPVALDTHARLELGVDPKRSSSASQAAVASFFAFAAGALVPLIPWFYLTGTPAIISSIVARAVSALGLGAAMGAYTGHSKILTALCQLAAAAIAATITYGVGSLLGVSTKWPPIDGGICAPGRDPLHENRACAPRRVTWPWTPRPGRRRWNLLSGARWCPSSRSSSIGWLRPLGSWCWSRSRTTSRATVAGRSWAPTTLW